MFLIYNYTVSHRCILMYRDGRLLRAKGKRREDCRPHELFVFGVIPSLIIRRSRCAAGPSSTAGGRLPSSGPRPASRRLANQDTLRFRCLAACFGVSKIGVAVGRPAAGGPLGLEVLESIGCRPVWRKHRRAARAIAE